ncbi:HEPN domain-containing protein [Micromonospora sp. NPDC005599]|uniref:ApeA N-terminal domain 1-containing protein n=1 Tax=Micromonospora sp. NPDC005599 TaxID=3155715 RepID=UPI0033A5E41B
MTGEAELRVSGRFWFADNPDLIVPGTLDLTGRRPRVELLGALSAFVQEVPSSAPGTRTYEPADPSAPRTIQGALMGSKTVVTLCNAYQVKHTVKGFTLSFDEPNSGLQQEVIEGAYAVVGAHIEGLETQFQQIRFRIAGQDAWCHHVGLSMEHDAEGIRINYAEPDTLSAALTDTSGVLSLDASATFCFPRIAGSFIETKTWLRVSIDAGISIREAWRRYVLGSSVLLTLLNDRDCPPVAFQVKSPEDGLWCDVVVPGLKDDPLDLRSAKIDDPSLISRQQLGLGRLARWFELIEALRPLPHLAAGTIEHGGRTVQNQLLELATAAEGLHRRLYPDERQLTPVETGQAIEAVTDSPINEEAKRLILGALRIYLSEPSFPKRLQRLAEDVSLVAPGITGRTNRWYRAISDARNGFAHSLRGEESDDTLFSHLTLTKSIRWLITARLLMELDVPIEILKLAFERFERYQQFLRNAKRDCPRVYAAVDQKAGA